MADSYVSVGITVTFATLDAKLLDVNSGGETADLVDVTHQTSTEQWREKLAGLKDGGEYTLLVHVGGTIPATGTSDSLVITLPVGAGTLTATAILTKGKEISATLGDKITETLTFNVTGKPVWT